MEKQSTLKQLTLKTVNVNKQPSLYSQRIQTVNGKEHSALKQPTLRKTT